MRDNTSSDSTSTKKAKKAIRVTDEDNHDAKGEMSLSDQVSKGRVEDVQSKLGKDKDHEYSLRSRGKIVKS